MSKGKGTSGPRGVTITYSALGTISIEEFAHALIGDIEALKRIYNISYVRSSRLKLFVTNEFGEELNIKRPTGGTLHLLNTHHYRPACKDYEL